MDSDDKRQERRKYSRKKVRVLVRFKDQFLFESFTYDVSLNGVFVLVDSDNVLDRLSLDLELELYLEYKLDSMMKAIGIVMRIQGEEVPEEKRGFALEIKEITGEHKELLAGIIEEIKE
jgi:hypothetical protein